MFKKFLISLFIIFLSSFSNNIFADSVSVEDVFSDISRDYKYYNELQTLYDKWMISPDEDWKFNPNDLLSREEFVWILMEVTCKDCIQPDTTYDLIDKYENTELFFDINKDNKYFYCIADANENWYISWYYEWTVCENWISSDLEKPFCPENTIILEEALAIILRASWILTNTEAESIRQDILNWKITESLSDDVSPKNLDWSVYSFYPDFKKALEYEVVDVDITWNTSISNLIEIKDWKLRPKQAISKEDFLKIAYLTLKANSCEEKVEWNISLKINIFDKTCEESDSNCNLSELDDLENIYDFWNEVYTTCESWIENPEWYIWRFYNQTTWETFKKYWKYIDNYKFLSNWKWQIFLRVIDNCWLTGEVYNTITIKDDLDLNVSIDAEPIYWYNPLSVDFEWIVYWWEAPFSYSWNFSDWNKSLWKYVLNIFKQLWVYEVVLDVVDSKNNKASASVLISVFDRNILDSAQENSISVYDWESNSFILQSLVNDSDNDWLNDIVDYCPLVKWELENNWCPILEKTCYRDSDCWTWYTCSDNNICVQEEVSNTCTYSWGNIFYWNMICNSCPCDYFFDFNSTLRECDVIFPAITSSDETTIYSRWEYFQIK